MLRTQHPEPPQQLHQTPSDTDEIEDTFYSEKIYIEPDLGDLRKSTDKALPALPKTPKRMMIKYRFSTVFPIAFAVASFVPAIVVVLARQGKGVFGGQYLVAVCSSLAQWRITI
jgi:hypothetical protein